ncbi:MAG: hypothetical protein H6765_09615 [Candidatus Peribacteria bacterium]|nr:MAG: hypothetical protein H6765_09615 [Candidatus Peribacteria bacterium]
MKQGNNIWGFLFAIIVSLFVIFFVGKTLHPETGTRSWAVVSDGLNHFKKGMDVA